MAGADGQPVLATHCGVVWQESAPGHVTAAPDAWQPPAPHVNDRWHLSVVEQAAHVGEAPQPFEGEAATQVPLHET